MNIDQAVILCGGFGKRLGKKTIKIPKPLIKIKNKSVIENIIKNLSRFGIKQVLLLCHYKHYLFKKKFHNKVFFGIKVKCIKEKKLLGSSGAIYNARRSLKFFFLLCNADTFFDINISDLIFQFFKKKKIAQVALKKLKLTKKYDTFILQKNYILKEDIKNQSNLINSGICILSKEIIPYLVKNGSLEKEVYPKLMKIKKVFGKVYKNKFLDMGTPSTLKKLPNFLNSINYKPCIFLDRDGVINKDIGYLHNKKNFIWRNGIINFIKKYNDRNYYIIILTNQSGIGRGYYKEKNLHDLHNWMVSKIRDKGGNIDKIYFSPYYKNSKFLKYRRQKKMRKPDNGMIMRALKDFDINLKKSIFIGDKETDKLAALKSNIKYKILQFEDKLVWN